jgi:hypothetical protein
MNIFSSLPGSALALVISAVAVSAGCGPSMEADRVLTPEERLQEQERLAYEQEQESRKSGGNDNFEYEEEEEKPFDEKHAQLELRRATLNAITCPETAVEPKKVPKAEADVNVVFTRDGSVKEVSVSPPFEGSPIEECLINAYKGVKVPPFKEEEKSVPWKADLTGKKRDLMKTEDDKEVENYFKPEEEKKAEEPETDKKGAKTKKKAAPKK